MIIIVNRGFDKFLSKIVISKNSRETTTCPVTQDCCKIDTREGDQIAVKLKFYGCLALTIASAVCHDRNKTLYICPTTLFKAWTFVNYNVFMCLFLLFFILEKAISTNEFLVVQTALVVAWALSLMSMGFCHNCKTVRKKMFSLQFINE